MALAKAHGLDVQKVRTAALLHDLARAKRPEELISMAESFGIAIGPLEARMPIFLHGPVAAALARECYRHRGHGDTGGGEGAYDGVGGHGPRGPGGLTSPTSWTLRRTVGTRSTRRSGRLPLRTPTAPFFFSSKGISRGTWPGAGWCTRRAWF